MTDPFGFELSRKGKLPLAVQISQGIGAAILEGRLAPGARLPSWNDLAAQLGVARGTVRAAYERLLDEQLITASGPAGTYVSQQLPAREKSVNEPEEASLADFFTGFSAPPKVFQMGVPAQDAFPFKLWSRLMARAARLAAAAPVSYPDPRGEPDLRRGIAAYLAIARGVQCRPSQIFITSGYAAALNLIIQTLDLKGAKAWIEDPGFPVSRKSLGLAGVGTVPVRVDGEGIVVTEGIAAAGNAAVALVTPGQQAPLGMALSPARRRELIDWARLSGAWIIEDDYLSELQLQGRAAPALAAQDDSGRVIHIGTFSKTITPTLRLGFVVVPAALMAKFHDAVACLSPASNATAQRAVAEFIRDGHYLRHLRRMKKLYRARRDVMKTRFNDAAPVETMAGLAVLLRLPAGARDVDIAARAAVLDMAPRPVSLWYARDDLRRSGLLLGVTNATGKHFDLSCTRLKRLIRDFS
ncbi:PLP-dependent aminotransferase family protein [Taklimakanibacter lacteus]|uniref:MocR-like pyridoxine biosynthesis transcription factor PdxR n=1 Tax=Taklimakanibacter lacteus TaxID=2268456 RepID=UPI000E668269